ncbi:hypothetical protein CBL_11652 [Carabus blaptoides fortunei]
MKEKKELTLPFRRNSIKEILLVEISLRECHQDGSKKCKAIDRELTNQGNYIQACIRYSIDCSSLVSFYISVDDYLIDQASHAEHIYNVMENSSTKRDIVRERLVPAHYDLSRPQGPCCQSQRALQKRTQTNEHTEH